MATVDLILARYYAATAILDSRGDYPYLAKHYARLAVRRATRYYNSKIYEICAIRRYRRCMYGAIALGRAGIAGMYARDIVNVANRVYVTPSPGETAHTLRDILPTNTEA